MKIIENVLFDVFEDDIIAGTITIPTNVEIIYNLAFQNKTSLKKIDLSNIRIIGNGAFFGCSNLEEINHAANISQIKGGAFWGCSSLKKFDISNKITKIEADVFRGCSSLENIDIPKSVKKIGDAAFFGCYSLKDVNIKGNIETIGDAAFWHCKSLQNINIPNSITSFGKNVFTGCNFISNVENSLYQLLSNEQRIDKDFLEEIRRTVEPLKMNASNNHEKQKKIVITSQ